VGTASPECLQSQGEARPAVGRTRREPAMTIIDTTRRPRSVGRTVADPAPTAPAGTSRRTTVATYGPTARPDGRTLCRWGLDIELDGIAAHEDAARIVAETARAAGARPVL